LVKSADSRRGPLAGIRVLDMGWSWSAPFAGMVLADLGAEVIKLESARRIDILRWSGAFADGVRSFERSGYYLACNRGKLSATLNLKDVRGTQLALRLIERSDVVLENFAPRVLPGLGLGPEVMLEHNPGLVMVSLSGYGADGPWSSHISYGDHLLHASGFSSLTGAPEDRYTKLGTFYGDPVGGLYATLAVLAGLRLRERSGRGMWFDLSQLEGLISMLPSAVIAASGGNPPRRTPDKSASMCPHGFYRCLGDDTWIALAAADDDQWVTLRSMISPYGADIPPLNTLGQRHDNEARVDAFVSSWTARRSPWEVTWACQRAGIAAYPVQSTARMMWDDHLAAREFFSWVHRPVTGPSPLTGTVFKVGDGAKVRGYAPLLGEHNDQVFGELLGLADDEYAELVASGVIA
jgi:crotonobetainyl-CoA:carnitine CoA-transferase CaiB-like acyl-CoA transferase